MPALLLILIGCRELLTAQLPHVLTLSLVRTLAGALASGCIAGVVGGIVIAHWQPDLRALLSAEDGLARGIFLIACMQVGAAVAVVMAMLPERDGSD